MFKRTTHLYRKSFSGLSRETWLLSLVMLINRSGTMVLPFLTLYITGPLIQRGLSDAGFVMALFGIGSVAGSYFGGRLCDRVGFYKVQFYSLILGAVFFILLGQVRSFPLLCAFTFLLSLFNEAFRPANSSAIAAFSTKENRTRSYSLNRLSINLGWAIGASLGGLVASVNYKYLFWIDGATNLAAAMLLLFFLGQNPAQNTLEQPTAEQAENPRSAYKDKVYLAFIMIMILFGICFFQLFTTVPNFMRDQLNLGEIFIGLVMALNGLIIVLFEMVIIYHLEQKNRNLQFIIFGLLICALAFQALIVPGPTKSMCLLSIVLVTIGEVMTMPFMNTYWTLRSNSRNRGQYAGLYAMAWGISQVVGPYFSTLLVEWKGYVALYCTVAFILVVCAVGFVALGREKKTQTQPA